MQMIYLEQYKAVNSRKDKNMGGPPSKGTPADQRKKVNNPNAGKKKKQAMPAQQQPPQMPPKKGK